MSQIPVHARFTYFRQIHVKSRWNWQVFHPKSRQMGEIVVKEFHVSHKCWEVKSQGFMFDTLYAKLRLKH